MVTLSLSAQPLHTSSPLAFSYLFLFHRSTYSRSPLSQCSGVTSALRKVGSVLRGIFPSLLRSSLQAATHRSSRSGWLRSGCTCCPGALRSAHSVTARCSCLSVRTPLCNRSVPNLRRSCVLRATPICVLSLSHDIRSGTRSDAPLFIDLNPTFSDLHRSGSQ